MLLRVLNRNRLYIVRILIGAHLLLPYSCVMHAQETQPTGLSAVPHKIISWATDPGPWVVTPLQLNLNPRNKAERDEQQRVFAQLCKKYADDVSERTGRNISTNDVQQDLAVFYRLCVQASRERQEIDEHIIQELMNEHRDDPVPSIIGKNEWDELEINWLIDRLDAAETRFGKNALRRMMHPVADEQIIKERQHLLQSLVRDEELYQHVHACLSEIKKAESPRVEWYGSYNIENRELQKPFPVTGGLLAYWDETQFREVKQPFNQVDRLFYSSWVVPGKSHLNRSLLALESSMLLETGRASISLLTMLGLEGAFEEFGLWAMDQTHGDLDLIAGFKRGLSQPLKYIDPRPTERGRKYNPAATRDEDLADKPDCRCGGSRISKSHLAFKEMLLHGNYWERAIALYKNHNCRSKIKLSYLGRFLRYIPWVGNGIDKDGTMKFDTEANDRENMGTFRNGVALAGAFGASALYSYYRLGLLHEGVKYSLANLRVLLKAIKQLHRHTVHLAHAMRAMNELSQLLNKHPIFHSTNIAERMANVFSAPSPSLRSLMTLLESSTFKDDKSLFYLRGRVLLAHKLFDECKDELLPALQAMGELDAYHSMATIFKKYQGTSTPFTFVEFIPHSKAMIDFENCWIPVIDGVVPNSVHFGGDCPSKLIITGPNGGGKSTTLKGPFGHAIVLAQSWGIAPASKARMSIIHAIRTCLHPRENLKEGMSTFMSEKSRVDEIQAFITEQQDKNSNIVIILDEPFKGTVDAESAERIYQFGRLVAGLNNAIVCIATHVQKPVQLAQDTNGLFANYHVAIRERTLGVFEREFRLVEGPANWWFDDPEKRSRFIDWLGHETMAIKDQNKSKNSD